MPEGDPAPQEGQQQQQAAAPWFAAADDDTKGHIQNRGWADKPVADVAMEAIKAHREAEKYIGVPAAQIARIPTDPKDEAGWKALWTRLGAPTDAAGYDFSTVKIGDKPLDAAVMDHVRATAAALNLPKDTAVQVAQSFGQLLQQRAEAEATVYAGELEQNRAALKENWGTNFETNMFVAKQTAAKLGVTPEAVAALEKVVGYAKVMDMFRSIGQKTGEADFISSSQGGGREGVMTKEQAIAQKNNLMADTAWAKRYMEGGAPEAKQMLALNTIIVGDSSDT